MPPELAQFSNDLGVAASLRTSLGPPGAPNVEGIQTSYLLHLDADEANRLVGRVEQRLAELTQESVVDQAKSLLGRLRRLATRMDLSELPPLRLSIDEDGAALVEWTLADRRLGFSLETDPVESGWYFATSPDHGSQMASGDLAYVDLDRVVRWAVGL